MRPRALDGRRLTASRALATGGPLRLAWFEADGREGRTTRGYRVLGPGDAEWRAADLEDVGVLSLRVVGVSHRLPDLGAGAFGPGEPVILMPEPDNPHDPWALAVRDLPLAHQAGYLPAARSRGLVEALREHRLPALALTEHRDASGARIGLRIAISLGGEPLLAT